VADGLEVLWGVFQVVVLQGKEQRTVTARQAKLRKNGHNKSKLDKARLHEPRLHEPRLHEPRLHEPEPTLSPVPRWGFFAANERMNQILVEHLNPAAWRATPPGKTRTIAAIFTHMHNVRCKWVRLTAPHLKVPAQLSRTHCTPRQARAGLAESAARRAEMVAEALDGSGRVKEFRRDGWGRPWPVGVEMVCYMLAHEAHHRGQVCMLAHQMGFELPIGVTAGLWNWERLRRECGAADGLGNL
jgi:uncharacterized damage-inducible protein DinB